MDVEKSSKRIYDLGKICVTRVGANGVAASRNRCMTVNKVLTQKADG